MKLTEPEQQMAIELQTPISSELLTRTLTELQLQAKTEHLRKTEHPEIMNKGMRGERIIIEIGIMRIKTGSLVRKEELTSKVQEERIRKAGQMAEIMVVDVAVVDEEAVAVNDKLLPLILN